MTPLPDCSVVELLEPGSDRSSPETGVSATHEETRKATSKQKKKKKKKKRKRREKQEL